MARADAEVKITADKALLRQLTRIADSLEKIVGGEPKPVAVRLTEEAPDPDPSEVLD